jgi:hypothetical protein
MKHMGRDEILYMKASATEKERKVVSATGLRRE